MRALLALALLAPISCAERNRPSDSFRPNIVLILADDLGFSDIGCYGSEIATPNLDRLAARGMRFTRFYNGARCCPTRASLLTGLHPHQAGVGHMVEDRGHPAYRGHLNERCVTIAEALRPAGYRSYLAGKWHVGDAPGRRPLDRGFDRYVGLLGGGSNYFEMDRGKTLMKDREPWSPPAPFYMTDLFTDAAVGFVEESTSPFFLYLAYTAPHWPLQAPAEEVAKYKERYAKGWDAIRADRIRRQSGLFEGEPSPRDPRVPPWEEAKDRELEASKMAVYAAMIDRMDQGIGRVLDALRKKGVEDRTLVVFLSDNGASAEEYDRVTPGIPPGPRESFHTCGPRWANVSNAPFRSYKHWVHEGGIATPFIAAWPGTIAEGSRTGEPAQLVDLMATFVDAAGAEYPAKAPPMEGRSLMPALRGGPPLPERPLFWEHEGNRAIRRGRWKLVARHKEPWELYDLEADRAETRDLAAGQPDRVRALAAEWDAWAARVGVRPFEEIVPPRK